MKSWVRRLPHPTYGNYGGARRECSFKACKQPIDWMDKAFFNHDMDLRIATNKEERKRADRRLVYNLKCGNSKKLGWYGKLYRLGCILIFSI